MRRLTFPEQMPWDAIAWLEAGSLKETEISEMSGMGNTDNQLRTERAVGYYQNSRSMYRRPMFQLLTTHPDSNVYSLEDAEGYIRGGWSIPFDAPMRVSSAADGACSTCYDFQYTRACPDHPEQPIGRIIFRLNETRNEPATAGQRIADAMQALINQHTVDIPIPPPVFNTVDLTSIEDSHTILGTNRPMRISVDGNLENDGDGDLTESQRAARDAWDRMLRASIQRHDRTI